MFKCKIVVKTNEEVKPQQTQIEIKYFQHYELLISKSREMAQTSTLPCMTNNNNRVYYSSNGFNTEALLILTHDV